MRLNNREDLEKKRIEAKEAMKKPSHRILVCAGTGCLAGGSAKIYDRFSELAAGRDDVSVEFGAEIAHAEVKRSGCHGFCEMGPLVRIEPKNYLYVKVKEEDCDEIFEMSIKNDLPVERLLYEADGVKYETQEKNPFYEKQTRLVLKNCGHIDAENIDEYLAVGGYQALEKALFELTPQAVVEEISESNLRGRGGGGFQTGYKWKQVARQKEADKYIVCNGDEGDPGAFMDRSVMEGDPHKMLEGMMIAGYAVGAQNGYIYVRAEYPLAISRLKLAIAQAEEAGLLGDRILGTDFSFRVHINRGAGAFVCGEETALMTSIEGNRGEPRPRPPFPALKGLFRKPTILNNVETLANIPQIILNGAGWFADMGTEKSKGTKVFALGGKVKNTGLVEIPMGTTLREIVEEIGGGIPGGKKFKAAQTGGPSGGCIPAEHFDVPIDYDNLIAIGSMMGSGGLIVMDEDTCMVDIAKFFLEFTVDESCGKCTPCRIGTRRMLEILEKITNGQGTMEDLDKLEDLAAHLKSNSLCALGQTAPNPVLSTLRYFKDEYIAHIVDKKCPAGVCKALLSYKIDADKCKGCTLCARTCPNDAITGSVREPHMINQDKCVKCGACMEKCRFGAIYKE